jgi:serine/threonine-protein kinase
MEGSRVSHYQIDRLLGRGGMGEVYAATDLTLGRRVALKFVAQGLASDEEAVRRFEREARAAAALNHPHIATLYAFEREGGRPFIAMELLSGRSLRTRLAQGPFSVGEALDLARSVAAALAHAHGRGIAHRDIKPENLMVDEHGTIKVTDFGLARAAQLSRLTMTGTTLGTAAYMGPEASAGQSGTPTDVFAIGVVLHEMLAGVPPWRADNPLAMMFAIAQRPPESLARLRPDAGPEVVALVERMLEKDPAARPAAAEVARELARITGVPAPIFADSAPRGAAPDEDIENQPTIRVSEMDTAPLPRASEAAARAKGLADPSGARRVVTEELETQRVATGSGPRAGGAALDADGAGSATGGAALVPAPADGRALAAPARAAVRRGLSLAAILGVVVALGLAGVAAWKWREARAGEAAARLNNEGLRSLEAGRLDEARGYFETALARDRSNPAALVNLGTLYRGEGQTARAESAYFAALPHIRRRGIPALEASVYVNLADMDIEAAHWDGAIENLEKARDLDSSVTVVNNLGLALAMGGRGAEARAEIARGLSRFPGHPHLLKNAGLAALKLGDFGAARDSLDRALRIDPGFASALGLRAQVLALAGDRDGARRDWESYRAFDPPASDRAALEAELAKLGVVVK